MDFLGMSNMSKINSKAYKQVGISTTRQYKSISIMKLCRKSAGWLHSKAGVAA